MEKEIKIRINSKQYELSKVLMDKLFQDFDSDDEDEFGAPQEGEEDLLELTAEGFLSEADGRIEITYSESELTGMEGATTQISFAKKEPELISMLRGGSVTTAMVFEPGKRHICVYETPIMPFELCIHTLRVKNDLMTRGMIYLDYIVEFKGAQAERTKFTLWIEEKNQDVSHLDEYDSI